MGAMMVGGVTLGAWLDAAFASFDYGVFSFLGSLHTDILTFIARLFTSMGSTIFVVLFAVMGLVMCFFRRTRKVGLAIVFAVAIGTLITNIIVKPMALRIRPYNTLQGDADYWSWYISAGMYTESDYCFPSGHTTGATEIAVALCLCLAGSKKKWTRFVGIAAPIVAFFVGVSRVYLMVHYATDVLAGWIVGIIAGFAGWGISCLVYKLFRKHDEAKPAASAKIQHAGSAVIIIAWFVMVLISFLQLTSSGGAEAIRCAYDREYNCQNEARVDDKKYPPIDGEYYCKIHWKQLTDEQN